MFNLRHSSLRNAIERIFGVLKKRFKILTDQLEYQFEVQVRLVKAMCCLHNIIRITGGDDMFDELWRKDASVQTSQTDQSHDGEAVIRKALTASETKRAFQMRDHIAEKMWLQYSKRQR